MIERHLNGVCFDEIFERQMRFISGPRQVGKTTLAKNFLNHKNFNRLYFNWDTREIRDRYIVDPYFFESPLRDSRKNGLPSWVCFDEIHKMPKWKNILKDYFDKFEDIARFIVTGSARLDWFRKSGDSLSGRYFLFKLHPLSLSEAAGSRAALISDKESAEDYIEKRISKVACEQNIMDQLLNYSGFPEPFIKSNSRYHLRWQRDMADRLIREDIRDLTRIMDVENIASIMRLIPEKVGSPLSINSLQNNLAMSYTAVKNAVKAMELTYIIFQVPPYSKKITRSLIKEKKCYLYDWSRCTDFSKRFENYAAVELKIMLELCNDSGIADFTLYYIRTKDGKETDFLITKNDVPWCLFEIKTSYKPFSYHHYKHSKLLGDIPVVQVVHENNVLKKDEPFYHISASRLFA